jgi:hypothetical protein
MIHDSNELNSLLHIAIHTKVSNLGDTNNRTRYFTLFKVKSGKAIVQQTTG